MTSKPLLVFDFDGVIVDGIYEYWSSSRTACLELLKESNLSKHLPEDIPDNFRKLRPWVTHGWEMVLLAAELLRPNSPLTLSGARIFSNNYEENCKKALKAWGWSSTQLQDQLDQVRQKAIKNNLQAWLAHHKAFPTVSKSIQKLNEQGVEFAILSTKSSAFTSQLLSNLKLKPKMIYGHESGPKKNTLIQLSNIYEIKGFIEDRRATLEEILETPSLSSLPCYLANWGYLKPNDTKKLPPGIHLLKQETLLTPLANWN